MALAGKVKTALDETRTLILGAQILLGFQCQSAFQDRFDGLGAGSRQMSAAALVLMVAAVGLLITPSAFHRIAENGESTGRMHGLTGYFAAAALLPFAGALGLDLTLTLARTWGNRAAGMAAGIGFAGAAAAGWYGAGYIMRRTQGATERGRAAARRETREAAPLHARIEQMLTEARVILPGAQALLGFQLVIVLSSAFEKLPSDARILHGAALMAVALAIVLLITPAALHRIVWAGEESQAMLRLGSRITILALLPLAAGMACDAYVVLTRMSVSPWAAGAAAPAILLALLATWYGWPLAERRRRSPAATHQMQGAE